MVRSPGYIHSFATCKQELFRRIGQFSLLLGTRIPDQHAMVEPLLTIINELWKEGHWLSWFTCWCSCAVHACEFGLPLITSTHSRRNLWRSWMSMILMEPGHQPSESNCAIMGQTVKQTYRKMYHLVISMYTHIHMSDSPGPMSLPAILVWFAIK